MKKRAAAVLAVTVIMFAASTVRIPFIAADTRSAALENSSMSIDAASLRGTIYDRNLVPLTGKETAYYAAVRPAPEDIEELRSLTEPEIFASLTKRLSAGRPVVTEISAPSAAPDSLKVFALPERYGGTACHIIGYTDAAGHGVSGIEKAYDDLLYLVQKTVSVRFRADAGGRIMSGTEVEISDTSSPQRGIVLTLDSRIQSIAEEALKDAGIEKGCAVVMDVNSGEIIACASMPEYDPDDPSASFSDERSPMINRVFVPFSVGSVFKPVVAAAALESGISPELEYECTGEAEYSGVKFGCHKKDGHGTLDMAQALAFSCNTYFALLGQKTGAKSIVETAEKFGFGKSADLAPGLISRAGNLPDVSALNSPAAIANISFGQGALSATPLQICTMTAIIANGGISVTPSLVCGETDENGTFTAYHGYSEHRQVFSAETGAFLKNALKQVVSQGSGTRAQSPFVSSAGKTATAQTGRFKGEEEIYNAWFSGWFPADEPEYAVTVMKEDGGEGALSCAPVFRKIAEKVAALT